jgi:dTDP-4-amino-4,6-dideoxygalactose transaminase
VDDIETPYIEEYNTTSANYYTVRLRNHNIDRSEMRKYLALKGIDTNIYYPLSLHLQVAYKHLGYKQGDFPESELAQEQVFSIPMFPEISQDDVTEVVDRIKEFLRK